MILSKKRETDHSQGEQTCGCLQGVGREWDGRRVWGWWVQTATFGLDGQWGLTIQHRGLCLIR